MKVKALAENLGLEKDEFLDLVELFVKTSASNLTDLARAIETGNAEEVVKYSHSLKGAAGVLLCLNRPVFYTDHYRHGWIQV